MDKIVFHKCQDDSLSEGRSPPDLLLGLCPKLQSARDFRVPSSIPRALPSTPNKHFSNPALW